MEKYKTNKALPQTRKIPSTRQSCMCIAPGSTLVYLDNSSKYILRLLH